MTGEAISNLPYALGNVPADTDTRDPAVLQNTYGVREFSEMSSKEFFDYWNSCQGTREEIAQLVVDEITLTYNIFAFSAYVQTVGTPENVHLLDCLGLDEGYVLNRAVIRRAQKEEVIRERLLSAQILPTDSDRDAIQRILTTEFGKECDALKGIGFIDSATSKFRGQRTYYQGLGNVDELDMVGVEYHAAINKMEEVQNPNGLRGKKKDQNAQKAYDELLIHAYNFFSRIASLTNVDNKGPQILDRAKKFRNTITSDVTGTSCLSLELRKFLDEIINRTCRAELPQGAEITELDLLAAMMRRPK